MTHSLSLKILLGLALAAVTAVHFLPVIPQWQDYHQFADHRTIFGIPNFWDVVSNLPFFLVALLGFSVLERQVARRGFEDKREKLPYLVFFIGVFLTGLGSAYYHWAPDDTRLIWDRIPITIIVMSLVSIILMEKTGVKIGLSSLGPLLAVGISSVLYWKLTGDLSFYGVVQFYPLLFIGMVLWLFPKPFPASRELVRLVVYYGLAKAFEAKDAAVYFMTGGLISGHTLKHLVAAFSLYWVIRMLQKRKEVEVKSGEKIRFPKKTILFLLVVFSSLSLFLWSMISMPGQGRPSPFMTPLSIPFDVTSIQKSLEKHVHVLALEIGKRHCRDAKAYKGLQKSEAYIRSVWKSQGYEVQEQSYNVGREVKNLFVEKKGTTRLEQILVIGAHYDGVPEGPAANDNGSGVAALLEISGFLAKFPTACTIQFVAFVNEEPPFFQTEAMGSRVYASRMGIRRDKVIGMISLETIGCYSKLKGSQKYPFPFSLFYPDTGDFITFVGNYASRSWVCRCVGKFRQSSNFPSEGVAAPGFIEGIGWSDQWSFWQEGYPALMVTDTAPFRYEWYHTAEDTPDKMDFTSMARVVAGLEKVILELAQ